MRPVLKQPALAPEQRVEIVHVIGAQAAPEHELMAARDDRDRIELQAAEVAHHVEVAAGIRGGWWWSGQALARDRQAAGKGGGQRAHGSRQITTSWGWNRTNVLPELPV